MRTTRIFDCPDQDQEVGAKHINETEMFQMTSREPMEPIDEEARELVDLEDVTQFEHTSDSREHWDDTKENSLEQQSFVPKEPSMPDLLIDWFRWHNVYFEDSLRIMYTLNLFSLYKRTTVIV